MTASQTETFDSARYWRSRHERSGQILGGWEAADDWKVELLNVLTRKHHIASVVDYGCGDGRIGARLVAPVYTGVDVAPAALDRARAARPDAEFRLLHPDAVPPVIPADMAISTDVVYHLVEDARYDDHLRALFGSARHVVVIVSSDEELQVVEHVRHRRVVDDVLARFPGWRLRATVPPPPAWQCSPLLPIPGKSFARAFVFTRRGV